MNGLAIALLLSIAYLQNIHAQTPANPWVGKTVHYYYVPNSGDSVWIAFSFQSLYTLSDGDHWHNREFTASLFEGQANATGFLIENSFGPGHWSLGKEGIGDTTHFTVADFQGGNDLWIILDPAGSPNAPPLLFTTRPPMVHILNPWPISAPVMVLPDGMKKGMVMSLSECGWFDALLPNSPSTSIYFEEISGLESYGKEGLGSRNPFDLSAEFATHNSTDLWLDTQLNIWLSTLPDKKGECQFLLAATVRDFSKDHPDFDFPGLSGDFSASGMVQPTIGDSRLPIRSTKSGVVQGVNLYNLFDSWWRADTINANPALRSYETCVDIPMSKAKDGQWEYDSYLTPDKGFWPIDNFNPHQETGSSCFMTPNGQWSTQNIQRNMNFCMETHARFIYQKGQKISFRGDDDLWMFVNNKLVVDFGGIHNPKADSVDLDKLGLTPGQQYTWDLFYCDRQPCASALRLKVPIHFVQQRTLDTLLNQNSISGVQMAQVIKRTSSPGSCTAMLEGSVTTIPTSLIYELWKDSSTKLETLNPGSSHNGGIFIAASKITVDTSKIRDLQIGDYRIVAYEPERSFVRVEIRFQVGSTIAVFRPKIRQGKGRANTLHHDALGRSKPIGKIREWVRSLLRYP